MNLTVSDDGSLHLGRCPNRQTFRLSLTIDDDGGPINLTGASARMDFRRDAESDPELSLSSESQDEIQFVHLSGQIEIRAEPEQVSNLCGYYVWGFALRDGSGEVPAVISGDVEFYLPGVEVPDA